MFPPNEDGLDPRACPKCGSGRLGLKLSRSNPFIGCSNSPECRYTRPFGVAEDGEAGDERELGVDPETGMTVFLKAGRFGPYVQLGEEDKPKRASLPKGWSPAAMDLEKALRLLRLPRDVGPHPEDGVMITAGIGRYGPFVHHNGAYANLSSVDEVFEVGLNRAVAALAEKKAAASARRGGEPTSLKDLGAHPADGAPIKVLAGRYGPYVKHGSTNATIPKGTDPAALTLEEAVKLIAEREAKGPSKKPARGRAKGGAKKKAKAEA